MTNVDGSEWYFPQRLTDDTGAVDQGNANPAQKVLGVDATMGHKLPRSLRIYAFGAYGGTAHHPGRGGAGQAEPDPAQPSAAGEPQGHLRPQRSRRPPIRTTSSSAT